jgi:protein-disulfide isomerase
MTAALSLGAMGISGAQGTSPVTPAAPTAKTTPSAQQSAAKAPAAGQSAKPAPLQLQSLDPTTRADPFPPANPKNFTATVPALATVDSYLQALLGYDQSRIWRVEAIQKTAAPGISRVVVYISDRAPNSKVQTATFFVTPDGKHGIADQSVVPFGAKPYAENRTLLMERANGPYKGAASKDLELVEFADLQCPHCKDAQPVMKRLAEDFPKARIVYQSFPLVEIHPYAFKAAAYGACVAKKSNDAFFTYAQAVYDTQGALTEDTADQTLNTAVTKAGLDPAAISACAATDAIKDEVNASSQLAKDIGVGETPTLVVNGRPLPLSIPYETLKSIIVFQAGQDGVPAAAVSPEGHGLIGH